ncbi:MAG: alpha/beta hydrolase [Ginsengibacter sp.]
MPFIKAKDGTNLYYKDWGTGKNVVFVHGWCLNSDSWEYVMNELSCNGYRCIAYDQRGCGRSDPAFTGYDYSSLADDLAVVLEELDLDDVTLVAHSMGCGIITRYLSEHGTLRAKKAVFIATTTPQIIRGEDNPEGIDKIFFDEGIVAIKKDRPAYVRSMAKGFFNLESENHNISPEMVDWAVDINLQASSRAAIELMKSQILGNQKEELKTINIPVLLQHGDRDLSSPLHLTAKPTHDLLNNCELKIYKNQGHGIIISGWDHINTDIIDFINK